MGMSFDYVLKLEDMARWYEPFSRLLGITDLVQDPAWNTSGREWRGGKSCFYTPPKVRCSDLFDDDVAACAAVGDATADEAKAAALRSAVAGSDVGLSPKEKQAAKQAAFAAKQAADSAKGFSISLPNPF